MQEHQLHTYMRSRERIREEPELTKGLLIALAYSLISLGSRPIDFDGKETENGIHSGKEACCCCGPAGSGVLVLSVCDSMICSLLAIVR
ncbi:Hypothetical predicted protein [Olea europaea subsp. europaea]|uniref:Uncharacterized protein n=1 Tax=Olea europaea subsp. europaea TaxID=158383 RepID=A0A8S0QIN9_OLEEU|nr:Hypothetical predicted protein [Olea europaea subsp. europaea]